MHISQSENFSTKNKVLWDLPVQGANAAICILVSDISRKPNQKPWRLYD